LAIGTKAMEVNSEKISFFISCLYILYL